MVEIIINNAPIGNTPYSSYFLNYGFDPCIIPDVWDDNLPINNPILQTPQQFMDQLNYNWKVARSAFKKMKTERKKYYDAKREPANFKLGDLVLVKIPDPLLQRIGGKLAPTVCGPFPIIDIIVPNTTYKVDVPDLRLSLVKTPSVRSRGCPNRSRKYGKKNENKIIHSAQSHSVIYARVCVEIS